MSALIPSHYPPGSIDDSGKLSVTGILIRVAVSAVGRMPLSGLAELYLTTDYAKYCDFPEEIPPGGLCGEEEPALRGVIVSIQIQIQI